MTEPHMRRFKLEKWATQTGFVKEKKEQSMSENGFLKQCIELNILLEEAHKMAMQIVGPPAKDRCPAAPAPTDHLAGRLDDLIGTALENTQDLIGQLNKIVVRFERAAEEKTGQDR